MLLPPGDGVLELLTWATKPTRWPLVRKYSPCLPGVVTDWPEPQPGTLTTISCVGGKPGAGRQHCFLLQSQPVLLVMFAYLHLVGWMPQAPLAQP